MNIDLLTTAFATASVILVAGAAYKWRRVPTVRLMRATERRIDVHRTALAGLAEIIGDARGRNDAALVDQLASAYRFHRRALIALDPQATPRSISDVEYLRRAA